MRDILISTFIILMIGVTATLVQHVIASGPAHVAAAVSHRLGLMPVSYQIFEPLRRVVLTVL